MEMTATAFQSAGASTKQLKPKQRLKRKEHDPEEPLCMLDVPGNYNNVAFRPAYLDKYNMTEFPGPWQGVGLGGNGCYNGALYQEPADWWWNDKVHNDIFVTEAEKAKGHNSTYEVMLPYFKKVRDAMDNGIHSRPSTDGVHYNHGLYDLLSPFLKAANFTEVPEDVLDLTAADERFFTVPAVCAKDGVRTGPRAWIDMVLDEDGLVRKEFPNLTLKCFTKVDTVLLDKSNEVTGVSVISPSGAKRGTLSNRLEAQKSYTINVNKGGKVIMCCGSLPTARVLYKSGLGCEELRSKVMPSRSEPFTVDNEAIGTVTSEHVSTSLGMRYTGEEEESPNNIHFDPDDFTGNMEHLIDYVKRRSGPYCQFGPVVASHFVADMDEIKGLNETYPDKEYEAPLSTQDAEGKTRVTTELFYNPYGLGYPCPPVSKRSMNPYNGPGTFTIAVMLLSPEQRGLFRLKPDGDTAEYPDLYLNETPQPAWDPTPEQREMLKLPDYRKCAEHDIGVMTASVKEVISLTDKPNSNIELALGPGDGHTHSDHKTVVMVDGEPTLMAIKDLDPSNPDHVKGYVTFWDKQEYSEFTVNGEFLPITHWQENHYNSTIPLARTYDVFGNELGDRQAKYGVDPDTCEIRGTKGLCVADASLFPKVVYCHPIGAVMALAEWAVDQILSEE